MTIRAILNRRLRRVRLVSAMGFGWFILAIVGGWIWPPATLIGLLGFAVAFAVTLYASFWGILCPQCRGRIFSMLGPRGGFSVDAQVRYCAYCGADFDSEIDSVKRPQTSEFRG